ncbi:MAG: hypothetical protein IJE97_03130 [Thermoguttaceae bacterium]|nr:hypothetical protein [Thermoguttaceae bacterium]MBQ7109727.1 hypothetical protein [Thermoguttaceae bacterium]
MNGLTENGERVGVDGSAKKGWRTLTTVAAVSGGLCVLFSVATFVGAALSSERVLLYAASATVAFVAAVGAFAWRFDAVRSGVFGTFAASGRGLKAAPGHFATSAKRVDASTGFSATCRRVAAALKRRGKRDFETLEPVSALLDFSTLEAGVCAAISWAKAIACFLTEPSPRWEVGGELKLSGSQFWGALSLALTAIALLLLATRALWTVALLCRKKGGKTTLLFWAGLIATAFALLEGAGAGAIVAVWE